MRKNIIPFVLFLGVVLVCCKMAFVVLERLSDEPHGRHARQPERHIVLELVLTCLDAVCQILLDLI